MRKGFRTLALISLAIWSANVSGQINLKPDHISASVTARQIRGSFLVSKVNAVMPVYDFRLLAKQNENWDLYFKAQFNEGHLGAEPGPVRGGASGEFVGFGLGSQYFPFKTRLVGLDVGVEAFQAKYDMTGKLAGIRIKTPDKFQGVGANLGLTGEVPLGKSGHYQLFWGVGYSLTETEARHAHASLDGWYGGMGVKINLNR